MSPIGGLSRKEAAVRTILQKLSEKIRNWRAERNFPSGSEVSRADDGGRGKRNTRDVAITGQRSADRKG